MNLKFDVANANNYQGRLDIFTQRWDLAVQELIELRKSLIAKRAALVLKAKSGISVKIDGVMNLVKPANKEEREAVVDLVLTDEVIKEKNLEEEIKFLAEASKNMRQLLSSEQSKMKVDGVVAEALQTKQL